MAVRLDYQAMQCNLVVSTGGRSASGNGWGFATVGRLPKAFRHSAEGLMDALVMYKWLLAS